MNNLQNNYSVNKQALNIIRSCVMPYADELGVKIIKLQNGTTVIDMGINTEGGFLAGKYFVEIGLGGLGKCEFGKMLLNTHVVPTVKVIVSHPVIAELSTHVAALKIPYNDMEVVLSGPIRALPGGKDVFSSAVDYTDYSNEAVALIQTEILPDEELVMQICKKVGVKAENLTLVVARTGTLVGAIQVCARNVEQSLPTLVDRGFPMGCIVQGIGITPIVSVTDDEEIAYGRVNDCLIYGQETTLYVDCEDQVITDILENIPFSKNKDVYGTQFQYLWQKCGKSWATVPRDWDAPCKVNFINQHTGLVYSAGMINYDTLEKSFIGEEGKDI